MNSPKLLRLVFVPTLLALLAAQAPGLANVEKGKTNLVRPDPLFGVMAEPPDADARGTLTIDVKESNGRNRLSLVVKKVNKALTYNLFVEDPDNPGQFNDPPIPLTGNGATKKLKLDTSKGDALPYGEESVEDLVGMEIRIVVGADPEEESAIYLTGVVPVLGGSSKPLSAKQKLGLANPPPDDNAKGEIQIYTKASNGDDRIIVKANAIDFDSFTFSLWVEDGPGAGTFTEAGNLVARKPKIGGFERFTKKGDPLPAGAITAGELSGRIVQIRNQLDEPFLAVLVPAVN